MKKTIHHADWGEVVQYTRYRGKGGRFVSEKWGRRIVKERRRYAKEETEEWILREGRRFEKISVQTSERVMKTTMPYALMDAEEHIYDALRSTNLFTQVSQARTAIINIRGRNRVGDLVRMQGEITLGEKNQDMQLTFAIEKMLEDEGYGDPDYYNTSASLRLHVRGRKTRRPKIKLTDTQFTVTLLA